MRYSSMVDRVDGLGGALWEAHHRALEMRDVGADVILLTLGEPDLATPVSVVDAAVSALRSGRTGYAPGSGVPAVRDAIAARYRTTTGRSITAEQVLFLPGTQTALFTSLLALAEQGDDVLVPEPHYTTYPSVIAASGARLVSVPLDAADRFHLRIDALEATITSASRVLLLNSPNNPTGATLSGAELDSIAHVAVANDLWVISDEVYADLAFAGRAPSMFELDHMAERTVVVSSLSKSHAMTGWRCGWAVGSEDCIRRITPLAEAMLFGSQPFLQDAAAFALSTEDGEVAAMRDSYRERVDLIIDHLSHTPGIACIRPEAGMFIMADIGASGLTGTEWAERLLQEMGVAVMPGSSFGPSAANFVRLSVLAAEKTLAEACARIDAYCRTLDRGHSG